jgi:hypothetical protein
LKEIEMFLTKVTQKIKRNILCSVTFPPENLTVYEIMWKNVIEPDRPQVTIRACALPKFKFLDSIFTDDGKNKENIIYTTN